MKNIKAIFISLFIFFSNFPINAQGIEVQSGGNISITGSSTIQIDNGNLINNGTYTKGSETVTLSGSTAKEISGSSTTSLHNLSVTNTGGITAKLSQLTANALTIASGSKLTIDTVKAVTVATSITNSAGTSGLLLKSSAVRANGTLIFHNAYESPVQATVEMYSKASKVSTSYKWQFFGIPVRSMPISPAFNGSYVRKFNEAGWYSGFADTCHWVQLQNGATLSPFMGYEVTQLSGKTYSFTGDLVNNSFESGKLTYTTGKQYPGQHLIGNPYTAAINIRDIEFGSSVETIIENSVYLYNTGSFDDWTLAGAPTLNESSTPGQYIVVPQNVAGETGIPSQIPSMQAFLVKVKSDHANAWVKIPYPDETSTSLVKNTTLQRSPSVGLPCTRIDVKGANFSDRMWIFTEPTCSRGFDNGWDGSKEIISSAAPVLFAMESSGNYQVNSVDNIHDTKLAFFAGGGEIDYTFTFTHQNTANAYPVLYLFDADSLKYTDITESGTQVRFKDSNTPYPQSRFKIVTEIDKTTETSRMNNSDLRLYNSQKTIVIQNSSDYDGTLELFDLAGRIVQIFTFKSNATTTIPTSISAGSYIAKAQTKTDKITLPIAIR